MRIDKVGVADVEGVLPLLRAYCDFYEGNPTDDALRQLVLALVDDPRHEGVQLMARAEDGAAVGFATVYWTWSTVRASRLAVLNDLYVVPPYRRHGVAAALVERAVDVARDHGAVALCWDTHADNSGARALYRRLGAVEATNWVDYELSTAP